MGLATAYGRIGRAYPFKPSRNSVERPVVLRPVRLQGIRLDPASALPSRPEYVWPIEPAIGRAALGRPARGPPYPPSGKLPTDGVANAETRDRQNLRLTKRDMQSNCLAGSAL